MAAAARIVRVQSRDLVEPQQPAEVRKSRVEGAAESIQQCLLDRPREARALQNSRQFVIQAGVVLCRRGRREQTRPKDRNCVLSDGHARLRRWTTETAGN